MTVTTLEGLNKLERITFIIETTTLKIRKLNQYKQPGSDGLYPIELKELINEMSPCLYIVFSNSADQRKAPSGWKLPNVVQLFKKGERDNPANYRPISLTLVPCKIFEFILADLIVEHLEKENLLLNMSAWFQT